MNALYRPGPMDYIPLFINRKQGKEPIVYPHVWLEEILKPTYGIMVYQEQIMQAAQIMAGYSLGAADLLRKAMGKKLLDVMEKEKVKFIKGAIEKGVDKDNAEAVFSVMEKFASYGFNRSHSAAYSVVAYQTAYLKAHYPAEYMAAVLTRNLNDIKKVTFYMDECKRAGIPVLSPDVNESVFKFVVNTKGAIRFGLGAIKGVGGSAVDAITSERKSNGTFNSIFDIAKRVNLRACNKRCLEALAMAGAFDSFENSHRAQYLFKENNEDVTFIDKVIKHANNIAGKKDQSQHSLFGETDDVVIPDPKLPECESWSKIEMLNKEREVTGIYISGHPLEDYKVEIDNFCNLKINDLDELKRLKNKELIFAGIITSVAHKTTKTGNPFGSFVIEDYDGTIQLSMFSEDYLKFKHFLVKDSLLFIKARVQSKYGSQDLLELKIQSIGLLSEVIQKCVNDITVKISLADISDDFIDKISKSMKKKSGNCKVKFAVYDTLENISIELPSRKIKVDSTDFLKTIAGFPEVKFKIN
jgi:DNA polymerase-3 subunit alpha